LAEAVVEPDKGALWCEVDLFAAFPPEETVRPSTDRSGGRAGTRRAILKAADLLQPVLVFVPIAITWFGLKSATAAYGEAIASSGVETARRPFLEMWQQGFDGRLDGWLKFDNVALMTLTAIVVLIVITFTERVMYRTEETRADQQAENLRPRLRAALTKATVLFGQIRLASPARFQAELTRSASEIGKVSTTVRRLQKEVVEALEKALEASQQTTDALVASAGDVQGSISILDGHLTAITSSAASLTQAVERTTYAIDAVGEKTDQAVDRVGGRLGAVITDTAQGMQLALDQATALTGKAVQDSVTGLDDRVGELVHAASGIGSAVDRVDSSVSQTGDRIAKALAGTSSTFDATWGTTGTEVREALGDWADTAGAHASRIEMASDTAGRTVLLLEETRQVLDRLPLVLSKSIEEIPSAVREITNRELADLKSAIVQLNDSVKHVATVLRGVPAHSTPGSAGGIT
jgi:hypothetical protein